MFSDSCSFEEFIEKVEAEDFMDLMYRTEIEATEAERWKYRPHAPVEKKENCGIHYAETLKNFLFYMRYGIRPGGVSDDIFVAFRHVCSRYDDSPFLGN